MSTRQDALEDRLQHVEDKLTNLQEQLDLLPDLIASRIQAQVSTSSSPLFYSDIIGHSNIRVN